MSDHTRHPQQNQGNRLALEPRSGGLTVLEAAAVRRGRDAAALMRQAPASIDTRPIPEPTNSSAARFMAKIECTEGGHWIWTASANEGGYGQFRLAESVFRAHRVAWTWRNGEQVPPGLAIDHLCGIPACIRPDHLEPVTQRENLLRGETVTADSASRDRCPQGHLLAGDNLRSDALRNGQRACRICNAVRVRAVNALSPGHPHPMAVAKAAVARLTGDETTESTWLAPLPIHRRLGLVRGSDVSTTDQLQLVGMRLAVAVGGV